MAEVHAQLPPNYPVPQPLSDDLRKLECQFMDEGTRAKGYSPMQPVLALLSPEFIRPGRVLLQVGPLIKRGRTLGSSSDNEYTFFLFNDMLAYANKVPVVGYYKLHGKIDIDSSFDVRCLMPSSEDPFRILVVSGVKSFVISFQSQHVRDAWLACFAQCITTYWQRNPSASRGVFAPLPPWLNEQDIPHREQLFGSTVPLSAQLNTGAKSRAVLHAEHFTEEKLMAQVPLSAPRGTGRASPRSNPTGAVPPPRPAARSPPAPSRSIPPVNPSIVQASALRHAARLQAAALRPAPPAPGPANAAAPLTASTSAPSLCSSPYFTPSLSAYCPRCGALPANGAATRFCDQCGQQLC